MNDYNRNKKSKQNWNVCIGKINIHIVLDILYYKNLKKHFVNGSTEIVLLLYRGTKVMQVCGAIY